MRGKIEKILIWVICFSLILPNFSVSAYASEIPNEVKVSSSEEIVEEEITVREIEETVAEEIAENQEQEVIVENSSEPMSLSDNSINLEGEAQELEEEQLPVPEDNAEEPQEEEQDSEENQVLLPEDNVDDLQELEEKQEEIKNIINVEEDEEVYLLEDILYDLGETCTTVSASTLSFENGVVDLINGNAVNWIDRIDLSGDAEVIRTFYNTLVEASDNDGKEDQLIEDSYFKEGSYIRVAKVTGRAANEAEIESIQNAVGQSYLPYIRAAVDAFDRDYPEVFWLSGNSVSGIGGSYSGNNTSGYSYTFEIKFFLKTTEFDVRDEKYQSQSAIKSAIMSRNERVEELLQDSADMSVTEKIDYFNEQLTITNQYNTSDDLGNIAHDCRECVSALEGRTGTEGPVCEAYARAFKVLCDKAGIPCVLVDGEARNSASSMGEGHMWNYVQVYGRWYGMDVTWNDPTVRGSSGAVSGYEGDTWSLVGTQSYPGDSELKFIESHPVSNTVSFGGISFGNGPVLEETEYTEGNNTYSISYELNGGVNGDNPDSYDMTTPTITLQNPTRTGYTFEGWYSDEAFTQKVVSIPKGSYGDKIFYAKWIANKYSIVFKGNGSNSGAMSTVSGCKYGDSYTLKANAFKRTGYTFAGWNTEADGSGTAYADKATVSDLSFDNGSTVILYAQWQPISYTIIYELNSTDSTNHEFNPSEYTIADETITLQDASRRGYTFMGWYSDKQLTKRVREIKTGSTGNRTLYAKWSIVTYKITYYPNGGTNNSGNSKSYKVTTADILLKEPTRTGYTFIGWYSDAEFNQLVEKIEKGSAGDISLYARWEETLYTITYALPEDAENHGENPAGYTISSETITLKNPSRPSYIFKGWYSDQKLTKSVAEITKGSTGDKTLYPKWEFTAVGEVEVPDNYLNVWDYGATPDDDTNDTEAFNEALKVAKKSSTPNTVYVPAGVYRVSATSLWNFEGLYMYSNTNLVMDNEAILYVVGNSSSSYAVIKSFVTSNISIRGGQIQGERYRHSGTSGEGGQGICLYGCSNVEISDMSIASNWGDGIYLGAWYDSGAKVYTGNDTISIKRCKITDNRRNNISIVDADNVSVERCDISDAHGKAPQCGILIEPNKGSCSGDEICSNILIKDTIITAYKNKNAVDWWCLMTTAYGSNPNVNPNYVTANGLRIENCTFNGYVGNYSGNNLTIDKNTMFNGTFVSWREYTREQ